MELNGNIRKMETRGLSADSAEKPGFFDRFFGGDRVLWVIIAILSVASLLVIFSSTASMAYRKAGGDTSHYFFAQLKFIVLGFAAMIAVHRLNYQRYARPRLLALVFVAALLFMLLTFFIGVNLNSASRWIRIPVIGVTFQPSDFLRIALIAILAQQLAKRQRFIHRIPLLPALTVRGWRKNPRKNLDILTQTTLPVLGPIAIACGAIFMSNFSTAAITFCTCCIMLYMGRVRVRELWRLVALVVVAMVLAVSFMYVFDIGRSHTWVNRLGIGSLLGETEQVAEQSDDDNLQQEQALIAIASGGLLGKGPGNSTQRSNLPHSYSDFAYAFIVEEYGFVGAMGILFLYLCIFFRGIVTFRRCGTAFPSLLVLGLCLMITFQAICNMLVSVCIFPVTGQTLPLISLGGSSIVFTCVALGLILGISRQVKEQSLDRPRGETMLD